MDRRSFMAGCASLALSAKAGDAFAQSGPLTKIVFPFAAGGGGDALCRILAQHTRPAARSQRHRREPHRRRRADRDQGGQGRQSRRHHHPGDHRSDHVSAADGGDGAELQCREGFHAGLAARALRVRRRRKPGDRRQGFQAAGGLAQGQPGQGDLWRAEQRHHSAFHGVEAGGSARHENDAACPIAAARRSSTT